MAPIPTVRLDGQVGLAALAENREPLVAQNMLEKGHDRTAAEQEIDRVLAALRCSKARRSTCRSPTRSWN